MRTKPGKTPYVLVLLVSLLLLLAATPTVGRAANGALTALADDELRGTTTLELPGLQVSPDDLGGIRFVYSSIDDSFNNASGIIAVIQVPGSFNKIDLTMNINIFVYLLQIQVGGDIIINLPFSGFEGLDL